MKGNFAIAALSSPLLHQLPFPVWLLALKSAIIFLLLRIAEVSSCRKGSMEIFGHSILNHFSGFNVRTPAFRRWNWFSPVFCWSFVLLLISFSSEFSVLAFCSFCSLIDKKCYRSGRWDLKKNLLWWEFSEELSMYVREKKWRCTLSAAETISLPF